MIYYKYMEIANAGFIFEISCGNLQIKEDYK